MLNCNEMNGNTSYNVVFPSQFAHLVIHYQQHPEAKSLAPDGSVWPADTCGLLQRAHVIAGDVRYVGKETDRKWEEGDEISLLEFAATEYGRKGKVVGSEDVQNAILKVGINKCACESGFESLKTNWRKRVGVGPTHDRIACHPPVLKITKGVLMCYENSPLYLILQPFTRAGF